MNGKEEILVTEDEIVTENVETETTEEIPGQQSAEADNTAEKRFSQIDINNAVGKAKARERAKVQKEYEKKYGLLVNVLKQGTGSDSVEGITESLTDYYKGKGVDVSTTPGYSDRDIAVLAKAEAADIIEAGIGEVIEETDRLSKIGYENMDARDRAVYEQLNEYRQTAERNAALAKIGVKKEVYDSKEFKEFAAQYKSDVPIETVYGLYTKLNNNTNIEPIGSMKNGSHTVEKEFYTPEEVDRLTPADYDNPKVMENVRKSMLNWGK